MVVRSGPRARRAAVEQRRHDLVREAFFPAVVAEAGAVETEQAVLRADPQVAGGILGRHRDGQVAQPLGLAIGLQRQLLGGRARAQEGERQSRETVDSLGCMTGCWVEELKLA